MRGCFNQPGSDWLRGADGVRMGYRLLLFFVLCVFLTINVIIVIGMASALVWFISTHLHLVDVSVTKASLKAYFLHFPAWLGEAISVLAILITTKIMTWLEDRSFWSCYLAGPKRVGPILGGILCGIVALSALIGILLVTGHAHVSLQNAPTGTILLNGLGGLILALLIGLNEELTFRGYIQQTVSKKTGFWIALILTSAIFGCAHISNPNESAVGIATVFGAGVVLCIGLRQTGALWWSIGFHAGWDFAQDYIYGTHDSGLTMKGALLNTIPHGAAWLSGGGVGPEGSIFALLIELIVGVRVLTLWRRSLS